MQFGIGGAASDTWGGTPVHPASEHTSGYGIDGDGDGIADVYNPGTPSPPPPGSSRPTAPQLTCRPRCSTGTTPPRTSATS